MIAGLSLQHTQSALRLLRSVIREPLSINEAPRILHPSFVDFITHKERCTNEMFWVDVPAKEAGLAKRCLDLMVDTLKQDMAGIKDETMPNDDVVEFNEKVDRALPSQLRYACLHWASHVAAIRHADEKCLPLLAEFTRRCLLNWMETASLLNEVPRATLMLRDMYSWAVSGYWLGYAVTDESLI